MRRMLAAGYRWLVCKDGRADALTLQG